MCLTKFSQIFNFPFSTFHFQLNQWSWYEEGTEEAGRMFIRIDTDYLSTNGCEICATVYSISMYREYRHVSFPNLTGT